MRLTEWCWVASQPGLRFHSTTELGPAFGPEWDKMQQKERRQNGSPSMPSTSQLPSASYPPPPPSSSSLSNSATATPLAPYGRYPDARSSSHLTLASQSEPFALKAMDEIDLSVGGEGKGKGRAKEDADVDEGDDGGASDGTEHFTRTERRVYRVVRGMQDDPEWEGTRYRLLGK